MTDPLGLARAASFIDAWPHPVAVVGGMAVLLRVRPRLTRDIDLVVVAPAETHDALLAQLTRSGYAYDDDIVEWLQGGLVRATAADGQLDLILADDAFLVAVAERARPVDVEGKRLPVATLEDLLLMKLEAGRPQDLDDALAIKDALADGLDRRYLASAGAALGVDALRFLAVEA